MATLIDDAWCELFVHHRVKLGISIDGPADLHDRHRRTRNGRGTHAQVMRGVAQLQAHIGAVRQAADAVVKSWGNDRDGLDDRQAHIRAVARAEFGRRGYEGTTIRDIAAAAGMGTGTVYRMIGSKDQLLASIMQEFGEKVGMGWTEVMRSGGSPVEKLDALSWVNTNALARFGDEFRIQLAWMRQSPPDTPNPGWLFATRLRQMKSLLTTGIRSGQIVISTPSREMLARCVIAVGWTPENMRAEMGPRESLLHVRDTLLRGVVARR